MQPSKIAVLTALPLILAVSACSDRQVSGAPAPSASASSHVAAAPTVTTVAAPDERDGATKTRRFPEPMVYLDGEAIAGLHFLELPMSLKPRWVKTSDYYEPARRFSVADYFEALGIDVKTVKEAHFIGGRNRHSIVSGAEILRMRDKLMFSFTQSVAGKPRMNFPSVPMEVNTQIDMVGTMTIYQRRTPPHYDPQEKFVYFEKGQPIKGVPYATDERTGGTRIYVDGKLTGAIKRKTLPTAIAIPGTTEQGMTRFGFRAYMDHIGLEAGMIQGMELVSRDEIAATFDAKGYADKSPGMVFTLPKRSRGRIQLLDLPEDTSKIDAILVYKATALPDRVAQRATPGSKTDQVKPATPSKKPGNSTKPAVAQPVQKGG